MLQFLPMLMQGAMSGAGASAAGGAAGAAGGSGISGQFMQALGASGSGQKSDKNVGMQYANAGLQLPNTTSATQALASLPQNQNQQTMQSRQAPQTFNALLQMLANGGK